VDAYMRLQGWGLYALRRNSITLYVMYAEAVSFFSYAGLTAGILDELERLCGAYLDS
jgi:hypothetical protein